MSRIVIKHKNPLAKVKFCPGCTLRPHRRKQVIGRGSVPAKLLFIAEAPGKTEDLLGEAMVGPSGNLLEKMIEDAAILSNMKPPSYYITNCVLCRPWIWDENHEDYGRGREPAENEILACMPNVLTIARIVNPELVVFIGRISERYYKKEFVNNLHITHPAFHLRFGGKASPMYQQDVRTLSEAYRSLK